MSLTLHPPTQQATDQASQSQQCAALALPDVAPGYYVCLNTVAYGMRFHHSRRAVVSCLCAYHSSELVEAEGQLQAPCGHWHCAAARPTQLLGLVDLHRPADVQRWRDTIAGTLRQMDRELLYTRLGPELLRAQFTPRSRCGAAYRLLAQVVGVEEAARFVEGLVREIEALPEEEVSCA